MVLADNMLSANEVFKDLHNLVDIEDDTLIVGYNDNG